MLALLPVTYPLATSSSFPGIPSQSRANRRGMLALVAATAAFVANDTLVKVVAQHCPLGEVIFVRGLMTTLLVGSVMVALGHVFALRGALNRLVLSRAVLEGMAAVLFTSALLHMPIAELSTITLLSPLIITLLSVLLFKEVVGWRRWAAISVGFVGTLLVVKPTPSGFDAWALVGVACAFVSSGRDLITRRLEPGIPAIVVAFTAAVAVTGAGLILGQWETWRPMTQGELGLVAISAGFLGLGNFLMVIAFRGVDVSAVVPFRYAILLWAAIAGFLVFREIPDRWAMIGAALIVASGLYALHRERVRGRELAGSVPPSG